MTGSVKYLGDGVYASFDGFQIWLDTRAQLPVNTIALEPVVMASLIEYYKEVTQKPPSKETNNGDKEQPRTV